MAIKRRSLKKNTRSGLKKKSRIYRKKSFSKKSRKNNKKSKKSKLRKRNTNRSRRFNKMIGGANPTLEELVGTEGVTIESTRMDNIDKISSSQDGTISIPTKNGIIIKKVNSGYEVKSDESGSQITLEGDSPKIYLKPDYNNTYVEKTLVEFINNPTLPEDNVVAAEEIQLPVAQVTKYYLKKEHKDKDIKLQQIDDLHKEGVIIERTSQEAGEDSIQINRIIENETSLITLEDLEKYRILLKDDNSEILDGEYKLQQCVTMPTKIKWNQRDAPITEGTNKDTIFKFTPFGKEGNSTLEIINGEVITKINNKNKDKHGTLIEGNPVKFHNKQETEENKLSYVQINTQITINNETQTMPFSNFVKDYLVKEPLKVEDFIEKYLTDETE
jgi:hypothetical protein